MIRKVIVGIGIAATGGPSDSISCGDHFGPAVSRGDSQLPQPGHQVFLRTGALDPVAVGTQQLQVLDVVAANPLNNPSRNGPLRDDPLRRLYLSVHGTLSDDLEMPGWP